MDAIRLAVLFNRPDVDQFLSELDAEQYEELVTFLALEPQGWQADRIGIQRLSYMIACANGGAKKLKEKDFAIDMGRTLQSDEAKVIVAQAAAIRSQIREKLLERKRSKRAARTVDEYALR